MIEKIMTAIQNEPLIIKIYDDEIIFEIYEIEIPIVYVRDTGNIDVRPSYYDTLGKELAGWDIDIITEIHDVMTILEGYKEELARW